MGPLTMSITGPIYSAPCKLGGFCTVSAYLLPLPKSSSRTRAIPAVPALCTAWQKHRDPSPPSLLLNSWANRVDNSSGVLCLRAVL